MPGEYTYYDFDTIKDPTLRLIYRVAARLNVHRITTAGAVAVPAFDGPDSCNKDLYVFACDEIPGNIPAILADGHIILIFNPSEQIKDEMASAMDTLGHGMTFHASRPVLSLSSRPEPYLLLCPLTHLPRQDYQLYT